MGEIFGLPCIHTEQAKLINSFQRFYPLSQLLANLNFFLDLGSDEKLYLFFEDIFSQWHDERIYVDLENIPVALYQLEDDLFDYLNRFSPLKYLVDTIFELTVTFENWLNRNQFKILAIMHQLFPQT